MNCKHEQAKRVMSPDEVGRQILAECPACGEIVRVRVVISSAGHSGPGTRIVTEPWEPALGAEYTYWRRAADGWLPDIIS